MNTLIASANSTLSMPPGTERNMRRDEIFYQMVSSTTIPASPSPDASFGANMARIASGEFFDFLKSDNQYIAYKAKKMVSTFVTEQAVLGCLIGCAVGDAVGLPVEGYDTDICTRYVNEIVTPELISTYHRYNFTFGQYSDDTQLTRETFITLTQCKGRLDPAVFALRIAMLFQPGAYRIVGYGKQTALATEKIRAGAHYTECGCDKGNGNGGVMRSACIGVILAGHSRSEIASAAQTMSSVTHASIACRDAAAAIALAAHYSLMTTHFDIAHAHAYITGCDLISDEFKAYIKEVVDLVNVDMPTASARIREIGLSKGERRWGNGISVGVRQTSLWALWCLCKSPDNYTEAISLAIAVGGDVDSTAAIVGALVGTRVGVDAIPSIWKECLHDYDDYKYGALVELGKASHTIIASGQVYLE